MEDGGEPLGITPEFTVRSMALTAAVNACSINNLQQKLPSKQEDPFLCRFWGQPTCSLTHEKDD